MTAPLKIFIGYDHRQPISYTVLHHSIVSRASRPVSIVPLVLHSLPITRAGLTPFTYSRFLVPYLVDYGHWALFLDADMLVLDDIANLFDLADDTKKVMVVKNPNLKFEWASMMLFNSSRCRELTPDYVSTANGLHMIKWAQDHEIGELPAEWNHCIGYDAPRFDAKLAHFTQGIPVWPETKGCEYTKEWETAAKESMSAIPWAALMGNSVHAAPVLERLEKQRAA